MRLLNSNRFYLPGTNNRYLHLASMQDGFREYICFANVNTSHIYIEQITGGHLEYIEEDSKVEDVAAFLRSMKVLDINRPFLPDKQWETSKIYKKR